jgi:DNA topoisomerase-1
VGIDPETGATIYLREGPYGPYLQLGETKTRRSLPKGLQPEEVDLETALKLLSLPRTVGVHPETKEEIKADYGRYGPYLKMGSQNAKLRPPLTPLNITLEQAVAVLNQRKHPGPGRMLGQHSKTGETLFLKEGRYGPYVTDGSVNASLPKDLEPATLTLDMAEELINQKRAAGPTKRKRKKR